MSNYGSEIYDSWYNHHCNQHKETSSGLLSQRNKLTTQISELKRAVVELDLKLINVWSKEIGKGKGLEFVAGKTTYRVNTLFIDLSINGKTALMGYCDRLKANGEINKQYSPTSKDIILAEATDEQEGW